MLIFIGVQLQRKKQAKVNDSVKKSLNLYADLLKKANKFKFATNFAENPSGSNRVNAVEHPPNQPMLINLGKIINSAHFKILLEKLKIFIHFVIFSGRK